VGDRKGRGTHSTHPQDVGRPTRRGAAREFVNELAKLGLTAATATIRKYRPKSRGSLLKVWRTFLHNHAMPSPRWTSSLCPSNPSSPYVLVVMNHARRKVVHSTSPIHRQRRGPHSKSSNASLRHAPSNLFCGPRSIYGSVFVAKKKRVEGMSIKQKLIAPRAPWQNPYVERLVGSIRRECLDRVIVFHEQQLRRIVEDYFEYYIGAARTDPFPTTVPSLGQ